MNELRKCRGVKRMKNHPCEYRSVMAVSHCCFLRKAPPPPLHLLPASVVKRKEEELILIKRLSLPPTLTQRRTATGESRPTIPLDPPSSGDGGSRSSLVINDSSSRELGLLEEILLLV